MNLESKIDLLFQEQDDRKYNKYKELEKELEKERRDSQEYNLKYNIEYKSFFHACRQKILPVYEDVRQSWEKNGNQAYIGDIDKNKNKTKNIDLEYMNFAAQFNLYRCYPFNNNARVSYLSFEMKMPHTPKTNEISKKLYWESFIYGGGHDIVKNGIVLGDELSKQHIENIFIDHVRSLLSYG